MKTPYILLLFLYCSISLGCNQDKFTQEEIEILADNFITSIRGFAPLMDTQKGSRVYVSAIDIIAADVKANLRIKESKQETLKLANDLFSSKAFTYLKGGEKSKGEALKSKLVAFEANKMSLIQEYHFVEQLFMTGYWSNWRCNLSPGFDRISFSLDTMILKELETYNISIFLVNGKNQSSPYWLKSNSLQKEDKHKIHLKTEKYQEGILKKEVELTVLNTLSGEEYILRDSFQYRLTQ